MHVDSEEGHYFFDWLEKLPLHFWAFGFGDVDSSNRQRNAATNGGVQQAFLASAPQGEVCEETNDAVTKGRQYGQSRLRFRKP